MRLPETLPTSSDGRLESHVLELPPCCPVSKNPRPGSTLTICYRPCGTVLEVGALYAYIHQYKGGLRDALGAIVVRDMEGMVSLIAQHCADAVGVPVSVCAHLVIAPKQRMYVLVRKTPVLCNMNSRD
jgi:hypothetical protein